MDGYSALVVLRDNQHVVTSRPMDSASMEQAASLITQCRDNQHVVTSRPMDSASMEQAASLITQCQLTLIIMQA
ncbi:hypothetical protein Bca101_004318 [Brassica carinata]